MIYRSVLYLVQRLCYSVRYRLGVSIEVVVKQAVVAVVGYEADLGEAARHIRAAIDEIVLSILAREAGLNAPVFGYPGGGERVTDVLRERGILGRRVRMNPYFNAVRILCAVAVKRNKELRLTDIRFPAPPGEGDKSIVVARHADLDPARFQLFFYRQRKLEIVVLFEPALILSAIPAVRATAAAMTRQMMRILFAVRFFICQQSTTSEPKGMNASFANLKY